MRVDPAARTVLAGAGCTWATVDDATHAFGLAVPSGIVSTGVAGLTLGGGLGHPSRKYGLTSCEKITRWAKNYFEALHPFGSGTRISTS